MNIITITLITLLIGYIILQYTQKDLCIHYKKKSKRNFSSKLIGIFLFPLTIITVVMAIIKIYIL